MKNELNLDISPGWDDYELIDSGFQRRLERFGRYIISRPDPAVIWKPGINQDNWKTDAYYNGDSANNFWRINNPEMPQKWAIKYNNLNLICRLTPFKHTGVFPEQQAQWIWIDSLLNDLNRQVSVLNLFAYTGVSTMVCAKSNVIVTHVDASKSSVTWASDNQKISNIDNKHVRWIVDDAVKFVHREIKRGHKYDAIIMDPPVYGHGPNGEIWDFNKSFPTFLNSCLKLLSEKPIFILINAYAVSMSSISLGQILQDYFPENVSYGELALQEKQRQRFLSTGIFAKWQATK